MDANEVADPPVRVRASTPPNGGPAAEASSRTVAPETAVTSGPVEGAAAPGLALSIVVPAFNESRRLADGMARLDAAVAEGYVDLDDTELLLVDDGSTDGTAAVAETLLGSVPHHRIVGLSANRGKGAAVRAGVAVARGRSIAYMDADMAIDPRGIPLLVDGLSDHDVVVGSRALRESTVERNYAVRRVLGYGFNRLVTAGTHLQLRDTQCGFKALRAPVARLLFGLLNIDRFAFDFELLRWTERLGLSLSEVPVQWTHVEGSTIHPFNDSLPMLRDVFRSRLGLVPVRAIPGVCIEGGGEDVDAVVAGLTRALVAPPAPSRGKPGARDRSTSTSTSTSTSASASGEDAASGGGAASGEGAGVGAGTARDACVIVDGRDVLVLFPLLPSDDVAERVAAVRAELAPLSVRRHMVSAGHLEAMRPLSGRVLDVA